MKNSRPMRWIEQAEAHAVLAAARLDDAQTLPPATCWRRVASVAVVERLDRVCCWMLAAETAQRRMLQAQPAVAQQPMHLRRPDRDDEGYSCRW